MFNVVLLSPKIPQNTGTIGRTCVAIGAKLHIIAPTPIDFEEKKLRRAGLDYWQHLEFFYHENIDAFLANHPINDRHFFLTTKSDKPYFEVTFQPNDYLWFGSEDSGLPSDLIRSNYPNALNIPMKKPFRSLNQSNAVSIVVYEALRQNFGNFECFVGNGF